MPACLRELFEQTIYGEQKHFPKNVHPSEKSHKSTLSFNGKHLPLPVVSVAHERVCFIGVFCGLNFFHDSPNPLALVSTRNICVVVIPKQIKVFSRVLFRC